MTTDYPFGKIPFVKWRKIAVIISITLIITSIASLTIRGLNLGIDFTGGTLVELGYKQAADLTRLRNAVAQAGFEGAEISYFGSNQEVLARIAPKKELSNAQISETIIAIAQANSDSIVEMRRVEFVGPKVGEELTNDGGLAILYALIGILIYIALRFEWRFALSSVVALIHDVVITVGIFSLLGLEFNLTVLAAVLAVIGYSLNDTIVVFDRIRENFINLRTGEPKQIINRSLNDMLARTLMTSITTLLVLLSLFIFGGEIIHNFSVALIIGILVGTYSSIYVASSASLALGINKQHLIPPKKEGVQEQKSKEQQLEQMRRQYEYQMAQESAPPSEKKQTDSQTFARKATKSKKTRRKKK
jgi:preprotein translocase subunit SecF